MRSLPPWALARLRRPTRGRNDEMMRISPTLLRAEWEEAEVLAALLDFFGDAMPAKEIEYLVGQAAKYVARQPEAVRDDRTPLERQRDDATFLSARREFETATTTLDDLMASSPFYDIHLYGWGIQSVTFLSELWRPWETVWRGVNPTCSGAPRFAKNFPTVGELSSSLDQPEGRNNPLEFISQCTFQPGSYSRCDENVVARKYLVVESDDLEFSEMPRAVAVLQARGFKLRALVDSGNRSLHAWFDAWPEMHQQYRTLDSLLRGLYCDPATLRQTQPVRFPGAWRAKTQRPQTLLYLA